VPNSSSRLCLSTSTSSINNLDNSLRLTKHEILFDALFDEFPFHRLKHTRRHLKFTLEKHCSIITSPSFLASLPQAITPSHYESCSAKQSKLAADHSGISAPCKNSLQGSILRYQIRKIFLETIDSLYSTSLEKVAPSEVSSAFLVQAFMHAANQFGFYLFANSKS
jgi:hypothetical protein